MDEAIRIMKLWDAIEEIFREPVAQAKESLDMEECDNDWEPPFYDTTLEELIDQLGR